MRYNIVMRVVRIAAILSVLSLPAFALSIPPLTLQPTYGPAGTKVRIAQEAHFLPFEGPVEVTFGGVPATEVEIENSVILTAVAPPQVPAWVPVVVKWKGLSRTVQEKFGYWEEADRIIIPIAFESLPGNHGTRWSTEIWVHNNADHEIPVDRIVCHSFIGTFPCSDAPIYVPAGKSMRLPSRARDGRYPAMRLWPPLADSDKLHFTVQLRELSTDPYGPGVQIPVVHSKDMRKGRLSLTGVPTDPRFRSTLRIYSHLWATMHIHLRDAATGEDLHALAVEGWTITDVDPFTVHTFHELLEHPLVRSRERVRIDIEALSPYDGVPRYDVWAMLTLTDNLTQRVAVYTPQ
jgi:hypothetical protein